MKTQFSNRLFHYCAIAFMLPKLAVAAGQLVPSEIVNRLEELEIESIDLNIAIALDTLADQGIQPWFSSNNQANGSIKILRSFEFDSSLCREIEIIIKQEGATDKRAISFCRDNDLNWQRLTYRFKKSDP
jgi:hypothetical protein